jgi:hypothetical protein
MGGKGLRPISFTSEPWVKEDDDEMIPDGVIMVISIEHFHTSAPEAFIGNRGKSLNFFIFGLVLEKGYFKELGLDVKLLSIKCDTAYGSFSGRFRTE